MAILQARVSSSRLPAKVLQPILGKPMLAQQIARIRQSKKIDHFLVATSVDPSDDALAEMCASMGVECFRGSLEDVLDRYYQAAKPYQPDWVIRLTGDCPLTDPEVIDQVITTLETDQYDYVCNTRPWTFPDGLDVEAFRFSALEDAWKNASLPSQREHVSPYIKREGTPYRMGNYASAENLSAHRWTVDQPEDFEFVTRVYEALYPKNPNFVTKDIVQLLKERPDLCKINSHISRNEGYRMSLNKDSKKRYAKSLQWHERAEKSIPLGTQTFSKSKTQYPVGVSPLFMEKAKGSHVWDVDGNEYIDYVSSQASITLGYNDPDVLAAVKQQIEVGTLFSLPHPLEVEVAEKIIEMVPSAEMVRFGKNGSDVTSAAIRLARAYTKRDRVATCGYHGWQDWYIGFTARNRGVPQVVCELTHGFQYNDIDSLKKLLEQHPNEFAAVIMEPTHGDFPKDGFLHKAKELAHQHGALFILDEIITGFRFSNGGAQELFDIKPDLTTLGKGMANGYPISAIVGQEKIMRLLEEVFFSFTFGGELLSLAAAKATMHKLQNEPVLKSIHATGEKLLKGVQERIETYGVGDILGIKGHPAWTFLGFKDVASYTSFEIKTLFLQEVFMDGVLTIGTHNLNYSHSDADLEKTFRSYERVFPLLKKAVAERNVHALLQAKPLENLFKIR